MFSRIILLFLLFSSDLFAFVMTNHGPSGGGPAERPYYPPPQHPHKDRRPKHNPHPKEIPPSPPPKSAHAIFMDATYALYSQTNSDFEKFKIWHRNPGEEVHIEWLKKCEDENLCDGSGNGDFYQRAFNDLRSQRIHALESRVNSTVDAFEYRTTAYAQQDGTQLEYYRKKELAYFARTNYWEGVVAHNNGSFGESREKLELTEIVLDAITSFTPGVSFLRDLYESLIGNDFITGEALGGFSRSMAILGVASGGILRPATKFISAAAKLARIDPTPIRFLYEKPISELKDTVAFFRKYKIFPRNTDSDGAQAFVNASMKGAKLITTDTDRVVYRYYLAGRNNPRGHWLTTDLTHNPIERLALENPGDYIAEKWIIPKGTEILEGVVAPNFGKAGGAIQIVIGDYSLLRKSP